MTKAILAEEGKNENATYKMYVLEPPTAEGVKTVTVTIEDVTVGGLARLTGEQDHKETTVRAAISNRVLRTAVNETEEQALAALGYEVKK